MATVLNRTTKQLRRSVNTPDFPSADWIINPDLSAVGNFASKYWTITGDAVSLMPQTERDALDAAEAQAAADADRAGEKLRIDNERVLKALAIVVKNEINILRALHGLPDRTNAQIVTAIKAEVDNV